MSDTLPLDDVLYHMLGVWNGYTRVWLTPGVLADESEVTATVTEFLDGRFALHEYYGSFDDEPMKGAAVYGRNWQTEKPEALWTDSFHQADGWMACSHCGAEDEFTVLGHYGDGHGGPEWGWRTTITMPDTDTLIITMHNITPTGEEAKAVETVYHRSPRSR